MPGFTNKVCLPHLFIVNFVISTRLTYLKVVSNAWSTTVDVNRFSSRWIFSKLLKNFSVQRAMSSILHVSAAIQRNLCQPMKCWKIVYIISQLNWIGKLTVYIFFLMHSRLLSMPESILWAVWAPSLPRPSWLATKFASLDASRWKSVALSSGEIFYYNCSRY